MLSLAEEMEARGHEQVVFVADAAVGLRAVIAVHSTALGPSLGGIRFWHYRSEHDALVDVLRLSEAMSLKAAAAGLHQGAGRRSCSGRTSTSFAARHSCESWAAPSTSSAVATSPPRTWAPRRPT